METFNFEVGKKFLLDNGITAIVLDIDFGGLILLKYRWFEEWKTLTVNKYGSSKDGYSKFSVVSEKPQEFTFVEFRVLYLENEQLKFWCVYDTKPSQKDIEECKDKINNIQGRKFYGIQKVVYKSDGTKDKINF